MKKTLRLTSIALVLMMLLTLASCVPGSAEKAKEKLKKKEYEVSLASEQEIMGVSALDGYKKAYTGIVEVVNAFKGDIKDVKNMEGVTAYYFEKASQAKDAFEKIEKEMNEEAKDEDAPEGLKCKRSGKVVYYGTEQAMKDFN